MLTSIDESVDSITDKAILTYCVQWDVDSLDWKDPTPEQIKQNIMKKIRNGSIILMHNLSLIHI